MADQPTINDFLDLLRVPLGKAVERALRGFEEELNAASRTGFGGNTIRRVLDRTQEEFESSVAAALTTLKRVRDATDLDASTLRGLTAQELENFLLQMKSIIQAERLRVRPGSPQMAVIDKELAKLDEHLRYALRQFDVGFFEVESSQNRNAAGFLDVTGARSTARTAPAAPAPLDIPARSDAAPGELISPAKPPTSSSVESRSTTPLTSTVSTSVTRAASITPQPITIVPTLYPELPSGGITVENYITINVNGADAEDFFAKLDALSDELRRSNEITGEVRDQLQSEIAAGRSILSAPKANRKLVDLFLVRPLTWLAEKAGSAIISKLAGDALEWLLRHL